MLDALRFWLDRGVDGFRVDVLWLLIKDEQFRDNPPNPGWQPHQASINRYLQRYSADQPEVHEVVGEMRAVLDAYPDRVLIGEIYLPVERLVAYYGRDRKGAQLPFNFQLIFTAWSAQDVSRIVDEYDAAVPDGCWPNWVLGNHDQKRVATRLGAAYAPMAAMLLLTLRGTPTLVLRRRTWTGECRHPARPRPRSLGKERTGLGPGARSSAHPNAVGRFDKCRLYHRHAVAAGEP